MALYLCLPTSGLHRGNKGKEKERKIVERKKQQPHSSDCTSSIRRRQKRCSSRTTKMRDQKYWTKSKESTHAGFEPTTFRESDFVPKSDALPLRQQAVLLEGLQRWRARLRSWGSERVSPPPIVVQDPGGCDQAHVYYVLRSVLRQFCQVCVLRAWLPGRSFVSPDSRPVVS